MIESRALITHWRLIGVEVSHSPALSYAEDITASARQARMRLLEIVS